MLFLGREETQLGWVPSDNKGRVLSEEERAALAMKLAAENVYIQVFYYFSVWKGR